MFKDKFKKVSESPTKPTAKATRRAFDAGDLYKGPATGADAPAASADGAALDEKLRQAYFWIVNKAIISPFYDIEYNEAPPSTYLFGDSKSPVTLPTGQSYSSFILLPILTFATRRKCLFVGGPGRGKTASAVLMGILAGYSVKDVHRAIQKGQPQMTTADLLGNPLPADLVSAKNMDQIHIAWRRWLGMRVKIIDEYNRIPTRTQSALLTVMADNYAEILDQTFDCPEAAWYLTANDDAGGGTYQVIEALRDRIDVVVKALHFNSRFLGELLGRIEEGIKPEAAVPPDIIFTEAECDRMNREILAVPVPDAVRRRLEFFASQFEFCEAGGRQLEYKTKDTVKLSGVEMRQLEALMTGTDRMKDLGAQTRNGLSVRGLMTALVYVKAMAYFRGGDEVQLEDLRQLLPFVLHDKLVQYADAPYFEAGGNAIYRVDKVAWIRQLFDQSCSEYERLSLDKEDPVADVEREFNKGLDGVDDAAVRAQLVKIERTLADWSKQRKLYGFMYDDILKLKYFHQRYTNYLRWLTWKG